MCVIENRVNDWCASFREWKIVSVFFSRPFVSILVNQSSNTRFRYPRVDAASSHPPSLLRFLLLRPHLLAGKATKKLIAAAPFASSRSYVVCVHAPRIHSYTTPVRWRLTRFLRKKITQQYETRQRNPPGERKTYTCVQCVRRREERFLDCLPFGSFLEGWHAVTYLPLFGVTVYTVFCMCIYKYTFFRISLPRSCMSWEESSLGGP